MAILSNDSINASRADSAMEAEVGSNTNSGVVYSADGFVLPNVPVETLEHLTVIDGWGEDRSLEGLELLNYFTTLPELEVTKINYTPEGFEASFKYGLQDRSLQERSLQDRSLEGQGSNETSFILGQLQTPSLTLLKEHQAAFIHALITKEEGELENMAGSLDNSLAERLIVPAPQLGSGSSELGAVQTLDQETGRIVKRKWITVYGWGVSLSE